MFLSYYSDIMLFSIRVKMKKTDITNYSKLDEASLTSIRNRLEKEISDPKIPFSDHMKNFSESVVFMGTTVGTVAFGAAAFVLATNEKAQELAGIENALAEPEKIRNLSLAAGGLAGGISGAINMVANFQKQRIEQAHSNAAELSYVDKLLKKESIQPENRQR